METHGTKDRVGPNGNSRSGHSSYPRKYIQVTDTLTFSHKAVCIPSSISTGAAGNIHSTIHAQTPVTWELLWHKQSWLQAVRYLTQHNCLHDTLPYADMDDMLHLLDKILPIRLWTGSPTHSLASCIKTTRMTAHIWQLQTHACHYT